MIFLEPTGMTNKKLDKIIRRISSSVEGELGLWQFRFANGTLICVTDETHNRMRVMSPIVEADKVTPEQLAECMAANFDRALDARYAISGNFVWSAFIHPLRELDVSQLVDAFNQVASLGATYGTTFTSGALAFGDPESNTDTEDGDDGA